MTGLIKLSIILLSILLFGKYTIALGLLLALLIFSFKKFSSQIKKYSYLMWPYLTQE